MFLKNYNEGLLHGIIGTNKGLANSEIVSMMGSAVASTSACLEYLPVYAFQNLKLISTTKGNTSNINDSKTICGFIFGSGNTAPTPDDYKLSGDIIDSSIIALTSNTTSTFDENSYSLTTVYTITNNGTEPITIGEIGLVQTARIKFPSSNSSGYYYKYYNYLLERTALETPITIEAGGVGQITYTIRMKDVA